MEIVTAIRKALAKSESVRTVAEKTGIPRENLYQFKAGTREFPLGTLTKLAAALGLEITIRQRR